MSDTALIDEILQRVEQMLDALDARGQSPEAFKQECEALQAYLDRQAATLASDLPRPADMPQRLNAIVQQLAALQKRAESKAAIPADLQKYIAEQND
jgi:hypothetical protein